MDFRPILDYPKPKKRTDDECERWLIWDDESISWRIFDILQVWKDAEFKLSHVANLLIRSHLTVTTKSSEWSEMVNCVKVFCFRPNWTLHNEIMVEDFIYNIFQKHQYCQILNFSKVKPTPPSIMLQHIHWATFVNSASFSKIFKFQTDLVMSIGQTFSGWCIKQMRQFTSKQSSSLPKKCRKIRFWDWY